jgi:hypothetical protein
MLRFIRIVFWILLGIVVVRLFLALVLYFIPPLVIGIIMTLVAIYCIAARLLRKPSQIEYLRRAVAGAFAAEFEKEKLAEREAAKKSKLADREKRQVEREKKAAEREKLAIYRLISKLAKMLSFGNDKWLLDKSIITKIAFIVFCVVMLIASLLGWH